MSDVRFRIYFQFDHPANQSLSQKKQVKTGVVDFGFRMFNFEFIFPSIQSFNKSVMQSLKKKQVKAGVVLISDVGYSISDLSLFLAHYSFIKKQVKTGVF
jgi:hypothetical protein